MHTAAAPDERMCSLHMHTVYRGVLLLLVLLLTDHNPTQALITWHHFTIIVTLLSIRYQPGINNHHCCCCCHHNWIMSIQPYTVPPQEVRVLCILKSPPPLLGDRSDLVHHSREEVPPGRPLPRPPPCLDGSATRGGGWVCVAGWIHTHSTHTDTQTQRERNHCGQALEGSKMICLISPHDESFCGMQTHKHVYTHIHTHIYIHTHASAHTQ